MTALVKPKLWMIALLCEHARPDEIEQYEAMTGQPWDADRVAFELYGHVGVKAALVDREGMPIVVGGWDPVRPGVYESWMVGTMASWERHWQSITRASRRMMAAILGAPGNHRLQTQALASRVKACEWYARGLGMTHEFDMPRAAANGETISMFSRVKEPV